MQRTAAITASALRRLAAQAINRAPVLSRAASSGDPLLPRPFAASSLGLYRPITSLLPSALQPSRGYAGETVQSDVEEDFDEDDLEVDLDEDDDLDEDLDSLDSMGEFNQYESGDEERLDGSN